MRGSGPERVQCTVWIRPDEAGVWKGSGHSCQHPSLHGSVTLRSESHQGSILIPGSENTCHYQGPRTTLPLSQHLDWNILGKGSLLWVELYVESPS